MEQKLAKEEIELDLGEIISVLLSKLWFIILMGIIVGLTALIMSKFVLAPTYSSSTKVYVLNRQDANANVTYADLQTGSQLTKDYIELVKSRTVLTQVISKLDLQMSTGELSQMIAVETPSDTRIITITVKSTDAYLAQKIANAVREVASAHICSVMNLEAVNVVDEADIPSSPSSPNIMKNTLIGVLLGLILAIGIVVVMYILDDTLKTPDDVERYLEIGVLASIPVMEDESKRRKRRKSPELSEEDQIEYEEEDEE